MFILREENNIIINRHNTKEEALEAAVKWIRARWPPVVIEDEEGKVVGKVQMTVETVALKGKEDIAPQICFCETVAENTIKVHPACPVHGLKSEYQP
jgi:hypothetical protein